MTVLCPEHHENVDGAFFCEICGAFLGAEEPIPRSARLIVIADGTTFDLAGKGEVVVGRADPSSQSFPDIDLTPYGGEEGGVSRVHLRIRVQNDRFVVEDQKSSNFTYLNKQRLEPFSPAPLKSGDELRLGRIFLRFESND